MSDEMVTGEVIQGKKPLASGKRGKISEKALANLRPFKPGQSGNPSGRPKKKWLTEVFEELLEEKLSDPAFRRQYKEQAWGKMLATGVVSAMTLDRVWERTEGKLTQPVDVSGEVDIVSIIESGRKRLKD